MKSSRRHSFVLIVLFCGIFLVVPSAFAADPLPSWNDGPAKRSMMDFVAKVTDQASPDFVPVPERIATFDNDGTLWAEQPVYFQLFFAFDRLKTLAPGHPEWKDREPFVSILKGDVKGALAGGEPAIAQIMMATHAGMASEEFEKLVKDWIATARHPVTKKLYTEMVYLPMLELLAYLRANGFKTFIVSGGWVEFMRPWVEKVYGIPPEQVVGSSVKTKFEIRNGKPVIVRLPELNFFDDKEDKPVGINLSIGRRPIAAFGNSDGDLPMLQYVAAGPGPRFCLYVHHTDAVREWAYDRDSSIGRLDKGLDEAKAKGWTLVDMKNDWKRVFAFELDAITAIDIAIEPDEVMTGRAKAVNARLLQDYPEGFALDASHHPHITMLQRYVRTADLDKVYAAAGGILAGEEAARWKLKASRYQSTPWGEAALAGIVVDPTGDLLRVQQKLIEAVAPFTVRTGSSAAFFTTPEAPDVNQPTMDYVEAYVPDHSGRYFNPHVTVGLATPDYLSKMLAEPFETFTFSPAGVSVFQLGNFGAARKKLKTLALKS